VLTLANRRLRLNSEELNDFSRNARRLAAEHGYDADIGVESSVNVRLSSREPDAPFIPYKLLHALRREAVSNGLPVNVLVPEHSSQGAGSSSRLSLTFPLNIPAKTPETRLAGTRLSADEAELFKQATSEGLHLNDFGTPVEFRSKLHAYKLSRGKNADSKRCASHMFDNVRIDASLFDQEGNRIEHRPTELDFITINHPLKRIQLFELYNKHTNNLDNKMRAWKVFQHNAGMHGYTVEPIILIAKGDRKADEEHVKRAIIRAKKGALQQFPQVEVRSISVPFLKLRDIGR